MALLPCPECGKQVSSVAYSYPFCGYPISEKLDTGFVRIKTPQQIVGGRQRMFRKSRVTVIGMGVNWSGELDTTARFPVEGPTLVSIDLGNDAKFVKATVYPNASYKLEYVRTRWSVAELRPCGNLSFCNAAFHHRTIPVVFSFGSVYALCRIKLP